MADNYTREAAVPNPMVASLMRMDHLVEQSLERAIRVLTGRPQIRPTDVKEPVVRSANELGEPPFLPS